jgi:glycosyltransferase involved in cell wall biosynthesis
LIKLLYVDCPHHYLSADNLLTFSELGIEWYATGYYLDSNGGCDLPAIPTYYIDDKFRTKLKKCNGKKSGINKIVEGRIKTFTGKEIYDEWIFTEDFINDFDIIFFNHSVSNIINNLGILQKQNKKVILKTFGMQPIDDEKKIGVLRATQKIIRVSNNEFEKDRTPFYGGHDAIIHGSLLPDELTMNLWNGKKKQVCIFTSCMSGNSPEEKKRREHYIRIKQFCPNYKFCLYGSGNENEPLSSGFVKMPDKIRIMRDSNVHLITGTPGSSCTYSLVESMVMGAPTVCYGQNMWQSKSYEPSRLFNHGEEILIGETPDECADYINLLMEDKKLCAYLGKNARRKAVAIYGRKIIANQWKELFRKVKNNVSI